MRQISAGTCGQHRSRYVRGIGARSTGARRISAPSRGARNIGARRPYIWPVIRGGLTDRRRKPASELRLRSERILITLTL